MSIELLIFILAPVGSIAMIIWLGLLFVKNETAKRIRALAYKIWAIVVVIIVSTILVSGLVLRIREGTASVKIWALTVFGIGLTLLCVWDLWNLLLSW